MLPIIEVPPANEACIYSTLLYGGEVASNLRLLTECIMFDQPL